jgi:sugar phosphate isomerase/epimerase
MLDDLNLRVAALSFPTHRGYNVPDDLERRVAATKQALQLAYDLGASVVVNHVGRIPASHDDPQWSLLLQVLADLGNHGDRVGARLAAKTGAEAPAALADLLRALPQGALGVDLDPGGLIVNGYSPQAAIEALGGNILHVHACDAVRDMAQGRGVEVALGRGSVDFPALLGGLEQHDYRGWLTIQRHAAAEPVLEIGQAVEYLQSLA